MSALAEALVAWRLAVGDEHVSTAAADLERCATATFPTCVEILAILRPASPEQVSECVRIAARFGTSLYPISRGNNWGLGSRVPTASGCVVVDLGRLNTITAFDDEMGTLTVQPGVTFRHIHRFLEAAGGRWFLPAIGGPADASAIGNLAERGDGAGPTGDRASHACALQVVLADGSMITTGFGMFDNAVMTTLSRAGPGPSLDGLFLQSGMGILTGATLFLSPMPAHLALMRVHVAGKQTLAASLDVVRALMRDGVLQPNCVAIWNATKVTMRGRSYPWVEQEGRTPLFMPGTQAGQSWFMTATIHAASASIAAAHGEHMSAALVTVGAAVEIIDEATYPSLRAEAAGALGLADDITAASVYWRKKTAPPEALAPEADRCGVHWVCLALPLNGAAFVDAVSFIEEATFRHSFEAVISGSVVSPRAIHLFVAIIYDRDVVGDDVAAQLCHDEILAGLAARGVHPMRLGIQAMAYLAQAGEPYAALMRVIRCAVDPKEILAKGRYSF